MIRPLQECKEAGRNDQPHCKVSNTCVRNISRMLLHRKRPRRAFGIPCLLSTPVNNTGRFQVALLLDRITRCIGENVEERNTEGTPATGTP